MEKLFKIFGNADNLWSAIKQYALKAGRTAARIVLQSYYVVISPNTPLLDKGIIVVALAYQLLPEDLLSKSKFGALGFLDNATSIGVAYDRVKTRLTPQIERQVEDLLNKWFGAEQAICPESCSSDGSWIDYPQNGSFALHA